ncbi:MAG: PAS domain-containing protein [Pseudorhodobacter sp.]
MTAPRAGSCLDITKWRDANGIHEDNLRILECVMTRLNDMVIIAEPVKNGEPTILQVNQAFVDLMGYDNNEVMGRSLLSLQDPDEILNAQPQLHNALETSQPIRAEICNRTKQGGRLWIEIDLTPIADTTGTVRFWVAVGRDISARKMIEDRLNRSEERFRTISRLASQAFWDWDLRQEHEWWNDGLTNEFGYPVAEDGTARNIWRDNIHPEDFDHVIASVQEAIDTNANDWASRYRFRRADGRWAMVHERGAVVRNQQGQPKQLLGTMTDITEEINNEERRRNSQKLEAIGQLTGGVAHDFNNLLTVILGNSDILIESLPEGSHAQRMARMILQAAQRGEELTEQLLAFSRRQNLRPKIVDINELTQRFFPLLSRALTEDITFRISPVTAIWPTEIDPGQLEVAMLNIFVNARDAMPQGGRISIDTANVTIGRPANSKGSATDSQDIPPGDYVLLSITDTGCGMSPEVLSRAFDPFFTTKELGQGTGLGLSMVYGFVRQSCGYIRIESRIGCGTSMRLFFPRAHGVKTLPQQGRHTNQPATMGGSEQILLVEDDNMLRDHTKTALEGLGYRVVAASSGADALNYLEQGKKFDLLFSDLVMPGGISGWNLAKTARILLPDIRILLTSGHVPNKSKNMDTSTEAMLQKPYRRADLAQKIRSILDQPK